ncbi:Transcription factor, partial [Theobroma cacao]
MKLSYITKDSARKATFRKRKKGLLKKASELSTLCGIEASVIIYSPYDAQPEVWPSPAGAQRVLSEFKNMPKMDQSMGMMSQKSFLQQRIELANKQLKRQCRDNREKEITQVMFQCLAGQGLENLNMMDLNDLGKATFKKRKKGLLKKASELSTLCGIDASVIIYSPYNTQPEVWPSPTEAERVLSKFKKMPKMDQSMEMMSQESFLKRRIELANKQLKKQCRDNREEEITQVMFQCLAGQGLENLNMMDLNDL